MNSGLRLGEKLSIAGETTALGLVVVFACLVLLIVVVAILSVVLKERKKNAEKEPTIEKIVEKPVPQPVTVQVQDDELLAVLTAAVAAAMEQEGGRTPFEIRSYKRTVGEKAWRHAGRDSQITNW